MRKAKVSEKKVTHLTEDEFIRRHQYCVTMAELNKTVARSDGYIPKGGIKAVCDHEEDGYCGGSISPEKLREVNDRLSGKSENMISPEGKSVEISQEEVRPKRGPGRPRKAVKEDPSYFCLQCNVRHNITQTDHLEFKRGRGRPKKS